MSGVVHIAGNDVQVGVCLRQRCAWCGAELVDYDLSRTASQCQDDCRDNGCKPENHRPATWPVGALVEVDGPASWTIEHEDGQQLPTNACAQLDPAVTV